MKIQWFIFLWIAFLLLSGKIFLFASLEFSGSRPDLLLILAIYIALSARAGEALVGAWLLGILLDLTTCAYFGTFSVFYTVAAFLTLKVRAEVFVDRLILPTVFAFLFSFQLHLLQAFWMFVACGTKFFAGAVVCAIYTAVLTPWLVLIFDKLKLVRPCRI